MKNLRINNGEQILVEISGEQTVKQIFTARSVGSLFPVKAENEFLPRRPKKGGITFYDLGVKDGSDVYSEWLPTITGQSGSLGFAAENLDNTAFFGMLDVLYDQIFAIPFEAFSNRFAKINKESIFSNAVTLRYESGSGTIEHSLKDLSAFVGNTLKLTQSELDTLEIRGDNELFYLQYVNLKNPAASIKVTSVLDVEAPAVEFSPTSNFEIYLFPQIILHYGITKYYNGLHTVGSVSDTVEFFDYLNYIYSTFPRRFYSDFRNLSGTFYETNFQIWEILKQMPSARLNRGVRDFNETPPYSYFNTYSQPAASNFPESAVYQANDFSSTFPYQSNAHEAYIEGIEFNTKLIFLIRQNGQNYFFWRL